MSLKDLISVLQIDLVLPVSRNDQSILAGYYAHPRDDMLTDVVRLFSDAGIKLKRPRPSQRTGSSLLLSPSAAKFNGGGDSSRLSSSHRPSRETAPFRSDRRPSYLDGEDDSDLDLDIERRRRTDRRPVEDTGRAGATVGVGAGADSRPASSAQREALYSGGEKRQTSREQQEEDDILKRTAKNVSILHVSMPIVVHRMS